MRAILTSRKAWLIVLIIMVLLSLDWWHWDRPVVLGWLALPSWLYYIVVLHLVLVVVLWGLIRTAWSEQDSDSTMGERQSKITNQ